MSFLTISCRKFKLAKIVSIVSRRKLSDDPSTLTVCNKTYNRDDWTNVTPKILSFTERRLHLTPQNPIGLLTRSLKDHFNDLDSFDYPDPVVTLQDNFDSLLIPKDHVSRSKHDTYYINQDHLLRCHTSAHQGHCLKKGSKAFLTVADVYRRDEVNSTHHPVFHQAELVKVFSRDQLSVDPFVANGMRSKEYQENHNKEAVNFVMSDLKTSIEVYIKKLLGHDLKLRWVEAYFPFTHPSVELEIFVDDKWMEILGAGVIENKLLVNHGVQDCIGWALGIGIERLAMIKYKIPDIRLFWTRDTGFSSQFQNLGPWDAKEYKPFSIYPQCINDMSFWIPLGFSSNDFYDIVRSVGGDLVEQVQLIDDFTNKVGKRSHCYRIVYRSHEKTLRQEEANQIHESIGKAAISQLHVQIR